MVAFLWVVWLLNVDGHSAGGTRMLATFPAVEDESRAALVSCVEVAQRLTRSAEGRQAYFCREASQ